MGLTLEQKAASLGRERWKMKTQASVCVRVYWTGSVCGPPVDAENIWLCMFEGKSNARTSWICHFMSPARMCTSPWQHCLNLKVKSLPFAKVARVDWVVFLFLSLSIFWWTLKRRTRAMFSLVLLISVTNSNCPIFSNQRDSLSASVLTHCAHSCRPHSRWSFSFHIFLNIFTFFLFSSFWSILCCRVFFFGCSVVLCYTLSSLSLPSIDARSCSTWLMFVCRLQQLTCSSKSILSSSHFTCVLFVQMMIDNWDQYSQMLWSPRPKRLVTFSNAYQQ